MSKKKKVLIIIQLCLAFSFLSWLLIQPSVKAVLSRKSQRALYEMIVEQHAFFETLSLTEQNHLLEGYKQAQAQRRPSFFQEIKDLFIKETSPFALAWLFFSIILSIFLLLHIEGAACCTWLLPIATAAYAYFLFQPVESSQETLFPSEHHVLSHYVEAEERSTLNKREALLIGWHRYLVTEWAQEMPSHAEKLFKDQLDRGLFAFNVARLKWMLSGKGDEIILAGFNTPPSFLRMTIYFLWNLFFAWTINRKERVGAVPLALSSSI